MIGTTGPCLPRSDVLMRAVRRLDASATSSRKLDSAVRSLAIILLVACHQDSLAPDAFTGLCSDQLPAAPTYTNVQGLLRTNCVVCHASGVELDLTAGVSYANLVGRTPPNYANPMTDEACGTTLVAPGNPDGSYLYRKLTLAPPCAGSQMPVGELGAPYALQPCELVLVHDWIAAGALDN
ncbi:hypothetical protein BH11MYX1_BH11MYX1_51910 [soil metagenome]